ncbi:beta-ketothiolase BktB [Rheinheimera gaetbuli]
MKISDVVILAGARTAIGSFGGSLAALSPAQLGTEVAKAAISRSGVAATDVDHAVFGHIITTGAEDAYLARHIALSSGMAPSSSAFNVNRLCGSAVQSVISAAQLIQLGQSTIALAGGAESMSNGAYLLPNVRCGLKMGHGAITDLTLGILTDPFGSGHMGLTAETIASQYGFSRADLDAFAVQSQQRAALAQQQGYFAEQIVPVTVKAGRTEYVFDRDEHIRADTTAESLAKLKPAFKPDGIVTAGNASGLNDGAAAMLLTSRFEAEKRGLKPQARLVGYAFAGVEPGVMGLGPIPAVQHVLAQTGLSVADIDVIESNEAFAAQALAVNHTLGFDSAKVNPNGGAIALGHPVGATGSILIIKLLAELKRIGGRYGLVTMCIGGGQGIALLLERL